MYEARRSILDGRSRRYEIMRDDAPLSFSETLGLWQDNAAFREFFLSLLADTAFPAYCWETPPITSRSVDRPFEFVLIDAPYLSQTPDPHTFASHFVRVTERSGVVVFDNLGGDATLIAPCPGEPAADYSHLGAFVRSAPVDQQHALLQAMGTAVENSCGEQPLWLSTAGGGVAWLHVRLDSRPKYYSYAPYRRDA